MKKAKVEYKIHFNSCDCHSLDEAGEGFIAMKNKAKDFFSNTGASVDESENVHEIIVSREDGRGLLSSVESFVSKSAYYEIR